MRNRVQSTCQPRSAIPRWRFWPSMKAKLGTPATTTHTEYWRCSIRRQCPKRDTCSALTRAVSALYQRPWTSNRSEGGHTHDTLDLDRDGSRGAGPRGRRRGAAHPARRRAAQAGRLEPAARGGAELLPHSQPERARREAEGEVAGTDGDPRPPRVVPLSLARDHPGGDRGPRRDRPGGLGLPHRRPPGDRPPRPAVHDEQSRGAPQGRRGAAALLHRDAGQEGAPPDGHRGLAVAARLRPRADAHAG